MALSKITNDGLGASLTVTSEGGAVTTSVQQGLAKAWIDVPAGLGSINASFNVSSLDDDGEGDGGINYTSSMSGTTYSVQCTSDDAATSVSVRVCDVSQGTVAAGAVDFELYAVSSTSNRSNSDSQRGFLTIHGDLA